MRRIAFSLVAVVALAGVVTYMVPHLDTPTAGSTHGAPLRETVTVVADVPIPNLPGKRLVSRVIDYSPGGSSDPHRHARSAFIYAYVLSGEIWRTPRSWVEKAYPNVVYFNEVDKGGHFAAWEEPQLFSEEVRAAFRSLR